MKKYRLYWQCAILSLSVVLCPLQTLMADGLASFVGPLQFVGPPEPPPPPPPDPDQLIAEQWTKIQQLIVLSEHEASARSQVIAELEVLHEHFAAIGVRSAESWSILLLESAQRAFHSGDPDYAAALARWSETLSPHSARIALPAARVNHLTGVRSFIAQLKVMLVTALNDRAFLVMSADEGVYSLLWALTFAMYVLMALSLAVWMKGPMRYVGLKLPPWCRGILTPPIVISILLLPLWIGPLWALVMWSFVILLMIPHQRWLSFYAGVVVVLWGVVPPIRETVHYQVQQRGVQVLLRTSSGVFERGDHAILSDLAENNAHKPVVQYLYGTSLKRRGEYEAARLAFQRAAAAWHAESSYAEAWAHGQLGMLEFLEGNFDKANALLQEAAQRGLSGTALILNQSKVAFALSHMETSLRLMREAEQNDPLLAAQVRAHEEQFGDKSPLAIAEFNLPFWIATRSLLEHSDNAEAASDLVAAHLMPRGNPTLLASLGALMIVFFFIRGDPPRRVRKEILYSEGRRVEAVGLVVRLIPGGTSLWYGLPGIALIVLTVSLMLAMPLLGWPAGASAVFEYAPDLKPFFVSIGGLWLIGTLYVGWHLKEREE